MTDDDPRAEHANQLHQAAHHPYGCPYPDERTGDCAAYRVSRVRAGFVPRPPAPSEMPNPAYRRPARRPLLQRNWSGTIAGFALIGLGIVLVVISR